MFFCGSKGHFPDVCFELPESKDKEATENRDYYEIYEYVETLDISNVKSKDKIRSAFFEI